MISVIIEAMLLILFIVLGGAILVIFGVLAVAFINTLLLDVFKTGLKVHVATKISIVVYILFGVLPLTKLVYFLYTKSL